MNVWKVIAIILGIFFGLFLSGLMVIGIISPETYIYRENEIPKRYLTEIKELGLVDADEKIRFFYSDALYDIKEGMYFVTDRRLTIYLKEWDDPVHQLQLAEIDYLDAQYDDSFITDSWIRITTEFGEEAEFPLSSEKKRDRLFVKHLEDHSPLIDTFREKSKSLESTGDGLKAHTRPRETREETSKVQESL